MAQGFNKDIYLCLVYVLPEMSTHVVSRDNR